MLKVFTANEAADNERLAFLQAHRRPSLTGRNTVSLQFGTKTGVLTSANKSAVTELSG